ncbi:UNVERIFIED_CONTAM: hypothetical protein K2H54_030433 [Gekko kuhli]
MSPRQLPKVVGHQRYCLCQPEAWSLSNSNKQWPSFHIMSCKQTIITARIKLKAWFIHAELRGQYAERQEWRAPPEMQAADLKTITFWDASLGIGGLGGGGVPCNTQNRKQREATQNFYFSCASLHGGCFGFM